MQGGTLPEEMPALPRRRVPPGLGGPHRENCRCSSCQLARGKCWYHYASAQGTREEAIEAMFAYYDLHPGKRRTPAREWCEVYRVREVEAFIKDEDGRKRKVVISRILYVRRKGRRARKGDGGNGGVDAGTPPPGT